MNLINGLFKRKKKKEDRKGMELAFEFAGHKFWTHKNINSLSVQRKKLLFVRQTDVDKGVSHEHLVRHTKHVEECYNKENLAAAIGLNQTLTYLLSTPANFHPVVSLASSVIYLDDEDDITPESEAKKLELVEKYEEVEDFFLTIGIALLNPSKDSITNSEAWGYLKNDYNRRIEKQYLMQIALSKPSQPQK